VRLRCGEAVIEFQVQERFWRKGTEADMAVLTKSGLTQDFGKSMETLVIPKPVHNLLTRLTGESRPDVSLSLALKDLVRLRISEARSKIAVFERKYGMEFAAFEQARKTGKIPEAHSYAVEQDDWEWEAATTDLTALEEVAEWLV
jgi:hypothetical protein